MAAQKTILIDQDGDLEFIWDDELAFVLAEGKADIRRASQVEPVGSQWEADMSPSGGPSLGLFDLRQDAIAAEITWLQDNKGL